MDTKPNCSMTELRKRANRFDVAKLVKLSGLHRSAVYALVSGKQKNPTLKTYQRLERAVRSLELAGVPREEKRVLEADE